MRLRWGPSPASCSASGVHIPACRHAFTPASRQMEKNEDTANYADQNELDKATATRTRVCFILSA